jgi:hypothetical protein
VLKNENEVDMKLSEELLRMPFCDRPMSNYKKAIIPFLQEVQIFEDRELELGEMIEVGTELEYATAPQGSFTKRDGKFEYSKSTENSAFTHILVKGKVSEWTAISREQMAEPLDVLRRDIDRDLRNIDSITQLTSDLNFIEEPFNYDEFDF